MWDDTGIPVQPTLVSSDDPSYELDFGVDYSAFLTPRTKVRFDQNAIKRYGVVLDGDCEGIHILTRCDDPSADYNILNTTTYGITNFEYSYDRVPVGFPDDFAFILTQSFPSAPSVSSPTANAIYNVGGHYIDVPCGKWVVGYSAIALVDSESVSVNNVSCKVGLGTTNDSLIDSTVSRTRIGYSSSSTTNKYVESTVSKNIPMELTEKTRIYLNLSAGSGIVSMKLRGDVSPTILTAVFAGV